MEIKEELNNCQQVSEYFDDSVTCKLLSTFSSHLDQKQYYLPFIGQFSAGKSKLINHILGKEILPTKSIETTAFLTYIQYGEKEKATLVYTDNTQKELCLDDIKLLDNQAVQKESKSIAALYISMPICLLKNGLTIIDTPGVNTLITEHVKMTEDLLSSSSYVVYVLGSSPSHSDLDMVKNIEQLQIPVIFVRTKLDLLKPGEEDINETIEKETEITNKAVDRNVDTIQ